MTITTHKDQLVATIVALLLTLLTNFEYRYYILFAFIGSACGAGLFAYFEPEKSKLQTVIKTFLATVAGVFFGAFITFQSESQHIEVIGIIFFLSGMLALISLRLLFGIIKHSGRDMIKSFLRSMALKFLDVDIKELEKRKNKDTKHGADSQD